MKVIISMSGLSSRFAAAGYDIPKFMIEVDGKTVIQHIIELYPVDSDFLLIINDDHKKDQELVDYLDNLKVDNLANSLLNQSAKSARRASKRRGR